MRARIEIAGPLEALAAPHDARHQGPRRDARPRRAATVVVRDRPLSAPARRLGLPAPPPLPAGNCRNPDHPPPVVLPLARLLSFTTPATTATPPAAATAAVAARPHTYPRPCPVVSRGTRGRGALGFPHRHHRRRRGGYGRRTAARRLRRVRVRPLVGPTPTPGLSPSSSTVLPVQHHHV